MSIAQAVKQGRKLSAEYMPTPVIINIPGEPQPDGRGGTLPGVPTQVQTKGRLRDFTGSEQVVAQRLSASSEGVVVLPYGTMVESNYTLALQGEDYNVSHVEAKSEEYKAHTVVFVARS
jgi:hypothetical protein